MNNLSQRLLATTLTISVALALGIHTAQATDKITGKATNKAPWQNRTIKSQQTSPIYQQEWRKSAYKNSCPILAIPNGSSAHLATAKSRAANFSDGFAVAYDVKKYRGKPLRSVYGVANAGKTTLGELHAWDYQRYYQDGSFVTSGHEGDNPKGKHLAYIVLNNGCFYNVWSEVSNTHLNQVINSLRVVK